MSRESPYFREILAELLIVFDGKRNINAKEYAEYLGRDVTTVRNLIKQGQLAGQAIKSGKIYDYIIPLTSIARFEDGLGKTR